MGQRLLLVDSDRSFLKEHQVSLEAAFDLEVSSSPDGVVARLERGDFAAVLICVEVADNKGYALCSTLHKHPSLKGVKIALISAKATEEEYRRHQSLKGKADLYLHKPISPSTLVAALAPLVPGRALDPDNPLGELVDTELGDDWLDSLRSAVDAPAAAPAPPPSPQAPGTPQMEALVASLREELRAKDQRLQEAEGEFQRHLGSVTLNLDDMTRRDQEVEALKAQLKDAVDERTTLMQRVGEKSQRANDLLKERDRMLQEMKDQDAALAAKDRALEAALEAQAQLNTTIEGLVGQHASLESVHQAALQEEAGYKEKAHLLQLEVAGLEATLRSQGRDLVELGARLQQVEGALAASQTQARERDQQLAAAQEELTQLRAQAAEFHQQLTEAAVQHDGERLELMSGLDQKEAELNRMVQALSEQQGAHTALEREKQAVHGQLSEHRDRLQNLDVLLQEIQEKLRRGSDLARG